MSNLHASSTGFAISHSENNEPGVPAISSDASIKASSMSSRGLGRSSLERAHRSQVGQMSQLPRSLETMVEKGTGLSREERVAGKLAVAAAGLALTEDEWGGGGFADLSSFLHPVAEKFAGERLSDHFSAMEEIVDGERVLTIRHDSPIKPPRLPSRKAIRECLLARLDVIRGIGPATASRLRGAGVTSIAHLADPLAKARRAKTTEVERRRQANLVGNSMTILAAATRWGADATTILAELEALDCLAVTERLKTRLQGEGHVLSSLVVGLVDIKDVVFFDTETLGLANNMIFMAGIGRFKGNRLITTQYLALGPNAESAVLERAGRELESSQVVVTYNGTTADLPWMRSRFFYYGLQPYTEPAHVDLCYGVRRKFVRDQQVLPDGRLPTAQEHLLGHERPDFDVSSWMIPYLYRKAVSEQTEGLLVPVIEHNRSDIESLGALVELLSTEALAHP